MMDHKEFARKMKSYTVLYVEDDVEIRSYMTEFLTRYCKKVYECDNANEGMELYETHRPDILLLDINLPGLSGIDMAALIREKDSLTRIVMSTAYTDKEFMLKAIELGLTRYLVKPVTSSDISTAFEKCITELTALSSQYSQIELGDGFLYDKRSKILLHGSEVIVLRKKEIDLLEFFTDHPGEIISYEQLETVLWSDAVMTSNAIRSQIKNLRKKTHSAIVKNISGIGYRIFEDES